MPGTESMEPLVIPAGDTDLDDLVFDLLQQSSELTGRLTPAVRSELARLVRSMNCYYSNFIEGHQTHPRDIDNALHDRLLADPRQRDLQIEARAHIQLQLAIDTDKAPDAWPASETFVQWVHR